MPTEIRVAIIDESSRVYEYGLVSSLPLELICNELLDRLEVRVVDVLARAVGQQRPVTDLVETSNSSLTKLGGRSLQSLQATSAGPGSGWLDAVNKRRWRIELLQTQAGYQRSEQAMLGPLTPFEKRSDIERLVSQLKTTATYKLLPK